MAWRIVKQPNGLLARFSDIVDDFTAVNMTTDEAVALCRCEGMQYKDAIEKVNRGERDIKPLSPDHGSGHDRWDDCITTIRSIHGAKLARQREKECEEPDNANE